MTKRTKTISYDHRSRLFFVLVSISFMALGVYIYAINATAQNIALHQNLEKEISMMSADLEALEFEYIALKNDITIELAQEYGFKESKNPLYVSRAPSASLSFNSLDR